MFFDLCVSNQAFIFMENKDLIDDAFDVIIYCYWKINFRSRAIVAMILRENERAGERAKEFGPSGW
jgi:hypothetical protein